MISPPWYRDSSAETSAFNIYACRTEQLNRAIQLLINSPRDKLSDVYFVQDILDSCGLFETSSYEQEYIRQEVNKYY